jgi:hypothetical protein
MNPYSEQELRMMFKSEDRVTITVIGEDNIPFDETFDNFYEAKAAIEVYELDSEVSF